MGDGDLYCVKGDGIKVGIGCFNNDSEFIGGSDLCLLYELSISECC